VAAGHFRSDLFYRLNVFPLKVPPLRERREDIRLLVMFFLDQFAKSLGKPVATVTAETMASLQSYDWPGNVRELQNVIERAVILSGGATLEVGPMKLSASAPGATDIPAAAPAPRPLASLEEVERSHVLAALEKTGWVIDGTRGAAAILKIHPNTLRSRLDKLGIKRSR